MDHDEPRAHGAVGTGPVDAGSVGAAARSGGPAEPSGTGLCVTGEGAVLVAPGSADSADLLAVAEIIGGVATTTDPSFSGHSDGLCSRDLSQVLVGIDHLRSALGALEMRTMTALDTSLRAEDREAELPSAQQGRRTAGEIQMASRVSPATASRRLRAGQRLVGEMPQMFHALASGTLSTEAAYAIGRAAGPVEPELRGTLDTVLDAHLPELDGASTGRWSKEVGALAHRLDPRGEGQRHKVAAQDRHVTVTAGPHGMGTVSAHLPGLDCAAIRRRLSLEAERLRAEGDSRTHAQIMADLLADTLLGRDETMDPVHLDVAVVVTERSLLSPAHGEPAVIEGYGVIDAEQVRTKVTTPPHPRPEPVEPADPADPAPESLSAEARARRGALEFARASTPSTVHRAKSSDMEHVPEGSAESPPGRPTAHPPGHPPERLPERPVEQPIEQPADQGIEPPPSAAAAAERSANAQRFEVEVKDQLRRVFTHPTTGELVAVESRARAFPLGLARYMKLRDLTCKGPYCDAPIRHIDHIVPFSEGGPTSAANGQGLCAHCNLTKEMLGRVEPVPTADGTHRVAWTSRLGRAATVSASSLTGLPVPAPNPDSDLAIDGSEMGGEAGDPMPARGTPVRGRRHLRLLLESDAPASPDPLDLDDLSPTDLAAMHRAAFESFTPDTTMDDLDILDELDRLDALGLPDDELGTLSKPHSGSRSAEHPERDERSA